MVRPKINHAWPKDYKQAVSLQEKLKDGLVTSGGPDEINLVAGVDVSYSKGSPDIYAAVVLMSYPDLEVVEESRASAKSGFPYIPGLLSFREGPVTIKAFSGIKRRPDVVIFDGQGIAHPRGFGLASHMGLLLGIPSIGCAKSLLVGEYKEPGIKRGSSSPLVFKGEEIGRALRTRDAVKPVYVSAGHMIGVEAACKVVLGCGKGYRLPEPTRLAHLLVNRVRREAVSRGSTGGGRSGPPAGRVKTAVAGPRDGSVCPGEGALLKIYCSLYGRYGPQHWWPADTPFEVMVGAILTQNTNWGNVERAIANLKAAGALSAKSIHEMPESELAGLIRPSGYFNIKAARLKAFVSFFMDRYGGSIARMKGAPCETLRDEILAVKGIGPETADSILLYALGCPVFVVDAYTKRIFSRHGFFAEDAGYQDVQRFFTDRLPADARLFNEYHALIVRLAKDRCLKNAGKCELCVLLGKA